MVGKIVYAYVVADLLHIGHVHALENAKGFAGKDGKLVVGILTDEATMEKKPKPTISFSERMKLVQALRCVDVVVAQETYSPLLNIKKINPDILMESSSHSEEDLDKTKEVAESIGCRVVMLPYYPEQSSTKIKESIAEGWKSPDLKNDYLKDNIE